MLQVVVMATLLVTKIIRLVIKMMLLVHTVFLLKLV